MRRAQLFEFCDLPRLPAPLRSLTPTFLSAAFSATRSYTVAAKPLGEALRKTGARELLDLGSGGAAPLRLVLGELERREGLRVRALLSDKFPDEAALQVACQHRESAGRLSYLVDSVDATAVPRQLTGFRTLFQLLHHFPPQAARSVLQDAVQAGVGIAVFEVTQRRVLGLLQALLVPFGVWLFTPFVRPLPLWRLVLTYLFPVIPLVVFWDALVSTLRSYTPDELGELCAGLVGPRYRWVQGGAWKGLQKITWLIGYPDEPAPAAADTRAAGAGVPGASSPGPSNLSGAAGLDSGSRQRNVVPRPGSLSTPT
jgi:hypothetical protein